MSDLGTLKSDMKWWLEFNMPDLAVLIENMPAHVMAAMIEQHYEGGMAHFRSVYGAVTPAVSECDLDPQLALRRRFRAVLGRPFAIAACHELLRVDVTDERIFLVMRVITEVERGTEFVRRLEQTKATVRVVSFDRVTTKMIPSETVNFRDRDFNESAYLNSHLKSTRDAMPAHFYDTWEYQS